MPCTRRIAPLALVLLLALAAVCGVLATAQQTIFVQTSLSKDERSSLSWYDYGKYLAFYASLSPNPARRAASTLSRSPLSCGSTAGTYYPFNVGEWSVCLGDPSSRFATMHADFIVGMHNKTLVASALAANRDAHVFAPTFNEERLSEPVDASRWTFLRPSLRTEAAAMLWFVYQNAPTAQSVSLLWLDSADGSEEGVSPVAAVVEAMKAELSRFYNVSSYGSASDSASAPGPLPPPEPYDVLLIVSSFGAELRADVSGLLSTAFAKQIVASNAVYTPAFTAQCKAAGARLPPITFTSHMPFSLDSSRGRFAGIQAAFEAARASVSQQANLRTYFGTSTSAYPDEMMPALVAGFTDMSAFLSALLRLDPSQEVNSTSFARQLHGLYTFGYKNEWLLGPVTGACTGKGGAARKARLEKMGLSCSNNQAGHRIAYARLTLAQPITANSSVSVEFGPVDTDYTVPLSARGTDVSTGAYTPGKHVVMLRSLDGTDPLGAPGVRDILRRAFPALATPVSRSGSIFVGALPPPSEDAVADNTPAAHAHLLHVDPIDPNVTLRHTDANTLYLTATLAQELHAIADYYHAAVPGLPGLPKPVFIACPYERLAPHPPLYDQVSAILHSHGVPAVMCFLNSVCPDDAVTVILEDVVNTVERFGTYLGPWGPIYIPYDTLIREYASLRAWQTNKKHYAWIATNLPPWDDSLVSRRLASSADVTPAFTQAYLDAVPPSHRTPSMLKLFFTMTVLNEVAQSVEGTHVKDSDVRSAVYPSAGIPSHVRTRSAYLGPYVMEKCPGGACNTTDRLVKNYGAQRINVWQVTLANWTMEPHGPYTARYVDDHYSRIMSPPRRPMASVDLRCTVPLTTTTTPAPTTTAPSRNAGLSTSAVIGTCVGCACLALIVIVGLLVYYFCFYVGNTRNNANAPKDASKPVTLIFTDIQSSTTLWALAPPEMADALAAHHNIIRRLIVKHKCYEVKTIGDAFIIACGDACAAVLLARDIQLRLFDHDWGTTRFDEIYKNADAKDAATGERRVSADAHSYSACWNGLRVRIGVHTGFANIEHDTVSKGYDYYGDTTNTAARTEALGHGGQVLLTESTVNHLTPADRQELDLQSLGPHYLRGVTAPIHMFQLRTVAGRVFPPIETGAKDIHVPGVVEDVEELGADTDDRMGSCGMHKSSSDVHAKTKTISNVWSESSPVSEHVRSTRDVLEAFFGPYDVQQRIKLLLKLCEHVGFAIPQTNGAADETYVNTLMDALCVHTSKVLDIKRAIEAALTNPDADVESEMGSTASGQRPLPREGSVGDLIAVQEDATVQPPLRGRRHRAARDRRSFAPVTPVSLSPVSAASLGRTPTCAPIDRDAAFLGANAPVAEQHDARAAGSQRPH